MNCRTVAEVEAAALEDAQADPPLTQDSADLVAAILMPHQADEGSAA